MSKAAHSLPEPEWAGRKFDIYSTNLSFLTQVYDPLPTKPSAPNFPDLYTKILFYQAIPNQSGKFRLPSDSASGSLHIPSIAEPYSNELLGVSIDTEVEHGPVDFKAKQSVSKHPKFVGKVQHGFQGTIDIQDDTCFEITGFGVFKLRKVWDGGDGKRLYEVYFVVQLDYGPMLRSKGHGRGEKYEGTSWAVEALDQEDSDEEDEGSDEDEGESEDDM